MEVGTGILCFRDSKGDSRRDCRCATDPQATLPPFFLKPPCGPPLPALFTDVSQGLTFFSIIIVFMVSDTGGFSLPPKRNLRSSGPRRWSPLLVHWHSRYRVRGGWGFGFNYREQGLVRTGSSSKISPAIFFGPLGSAMVLSRVIPHRLQRPTPLFAVSSLSRSQDKR